MSDTVWIDVTEVGPSTEKAILMDTDDGEKWVPRSQMGGRKKEDGKIVRCEVSKWWAGKEGLHDEKDDS